jgi:pimeloyl-ACP methyl ester carboxylesterase
VTAHHVSLAGRRLEVQDTPGDPARPALVFLHEALGSVGLWRGFPEEVAAATGCRAVAYSRFGHGASDPPAGPRTPSFFDEEAQEVLPALLAELGIVEPVLVGHSDGATIALVHAAAHAVRGVVAMAPHVFMESEALDGIRAAREAYASGGLRERMARHHRDPDHPFGGWSGLWLSPAFAAWSIEEQLERITAQLLLVQGSEDEYGTLAQLDAIERRVAGPVRRLVTDGGHSPHLDRRAEVLGALRTFVGSVT